MKIATKNTVLITGASKGIGLCITKHLLELGYDVVGIARTQAEHDYPGHFYAADLTNTQSTQHVFNTIKEKHNIIGIVNNVGFAKPEFIEEISLDSFDAVMNINVKTAILALQTFLPQMKLKGFGRVVNISSRAILGKPGRSSYSAAKASLIALTRTWAAELAKYKITVNAIAPGPIETEGYHRNHPPGSNAYKQGVSLIPIGRIGKPMDVAHAVGFFLDGKSGFITAQTLFVDGGKSIGAG